MCHCATDSAIAHHITEQSVMRRRSQILAHFGSFLHLQPELDKPADGPFSTASSQLNAEPFALVLNRSYRSPKNRGSFFQRG
jgi:hypothetical protein